MGFWGKINGIYFQVLYSKLLRATRDVSLKIDASTARGWWPSIAALKLSCASPPL